MTVLTIIGVLIAAGALYWFMIKVNSYTHKAYKHEIFKLESFMISTVSYLLIFFGRTNYLNALDTGGDILNGQLLVGIGVLILIGIIIYNIKNTSIIIGTVLSIVQVVLYIPLAVAALFAGIMAMAYFSQTRPVYNIN